MTKYTYDHPRPMVTCDAVIFSRETPTSPAFILLIKRRNDPYKDHWALPGGFLDLHENVESCAQRELHEETGLQVKAFAPLTARAQSGRDPRGRVITFPFVTAITGPHPALTPSDDAIEARWFPVTDLPPLAFDHSDIITEAKDSAAYNITPGLTPEEKQLYLDQDGSTCPRCQSPHLSCPPLELDDAGPLQEVSCDNCHATWTDRYRLDDIVEFETN